MPPERAGGVGGGSARRPAGPAASPPLPRPPPKSPIPLHPPASFIRRGDDAPLLLSHRRRAARPTNQHDQHALRVTEPHRRPRVSGGSHQRAAGSDAASSSAFAPPGGPFAADDCLRPGAGSGASFRVLVPAARRLSPFDLTFLHVPPQERWLAGSFGPQVGCSLSLSRRHKHADTPGPAGGGAAAFDPRFAPSSPPRLDSTHRQAVRRLRGKVVSLPLSTQIQIPV